MDSDDRVTDVTHAGGKLPPVSATPTNRKKPD
jgi:hypothetical protein